MSKIFSFFVYFTSFLPLWISILFINIKSFIKEERNRCTEVITIIVIVVVLCISICALMYVLNDKNKEGTIEVTLKNVVVEKTRTSEYVLSCILPLLTFDFTRWDSVVIFLVFFSSLGFLNIRHNNLSVNIFLEIFKFKFYKCEIATENTVIIKYVISKRNLQLNKDSCMYLKSLNNEYKLDVY